MLGALDDGRITPPGPANAVAAGPPPARPPPGRLGRRRPPPRGGRAGRPARREGHRPPGRSRRPTRPGESRIVRPAGPPRPAGRGRARPVRPVGPPSGPRPGRGPAGRAGPRRAGPPGPPASRPSVLRSGRSAEETMLRWVALGVPRPRGPPPGRRAATGVMVGGRGVRLAPESVVRDAEFFVALDPREDRRGGALEARVRIASALRPEWLEELFPGAIRRERTVRFDEERRRVVGVTITRYRDLALREDPDAPFDPASRSRPPWPSTSAPSPRRWSGPTTPPRRGWPASPCSAAPCPRPTCPSSTTRPSPTSWPTPAPARGASRRSSGPPGCPC